MRGEVVALGWVEEGGEVFEEMGALLGEWRDEVVRKRRWRRWLWRGDCEIGGGSDSG